MAFYTVLSQDSDGVKRSTTLEASSKDEATKLVENLNAAVADQEQVEAYTVSDVTKDS